MKTAGIIGGLDILGCDITLKFLAEDFFVKATDSGLKNTNYKYTAEGIRAHKNLQVYNINPEEVVQLRRFIAGCDIIIHCGSPFILGNGANGTQILIPVIKKTGLLLKVIRETASVKKVYIIASPAVFVPGTTNTQETNPEKLHGKGKKQPTLFKFAHYHAEMAMQTRIGNFSNQLFQVVIVAPIELSKNFLSNSKDSTTIGLQYIFRAKLAQDPFLNILVRQNVLQTMIDIKDLPDLIFNSLPEFTPYTGQSLKAF